MAIYIPRGNGGGGAVSISGAYTKNEADSLFTTKVTTYALSSHMYNIDESLQTQIDNISGHLNGYTTLTVTAAISSQLNSVDVGLQSQINNITGSYAKNSYVGIISGNLTNRDSQLQTQINELATSQYLVFREQFTGNGSSVQYQLSGAVTNAQFISGAWNSANVLNTFEANITDLNGKPIYDGSIVSLFTRHRISVSSITGNGYVNLDYSPLLNQQFYVWYWYNLANADRIDNYYRDDYVAKMEETAGNLASNIATNTLNFNNILSVTDTNVQTSLETIDYKTISKTETAAISGYLLSRINSISGGTAGPSSDLSLYTLISVTNALTGQLATLIKDTSAAIVVYDLTQDAALSGALVSLINNKANESGVVHITGSETIIGSKRFSSDIFVTATGSLSATPRTIGIDTMAVGNYARFLFGDTGNAWQNGNGYAMHMYSYHSLILGGDRNTTTPPNFDNVSNVGTIIRGSSQNTPVLYVQNLGSNIIQAWTDNSYNYLAFVNSAGSIGTSGTLSAKTLAGISGGIVVHDNNGVLFDSGVLYTSLALTSNAASMSANALAQSTSLIANTSAAIISYDNVQDAAISGGLVVLTYSASANALAQASSLVAIVSAGIVSYDVAQDAALSGALVSLTYNTSSNAYIQALNNLQPKIDSANSNIVYLASITGGFATSSLVASTSAIVVNYDLGQDAAMSGALVILTYSTSANAYNQAIVYTNIASGNLTQYINNSTASLAAVASASANSYQQSISYTNIISGNLIQYINSGSVSLASVAAASANAYQQSINNIQPKLDAQQNTLSSLTSLTGSSVTPSLTGYTLLTTTSYLTGILQTEIDNINVDIRYLASITGTLAPISLVSDTSAAIINYDIAQDASMSGALVSLISVKSNNSTVVHTTGNESISGVKTFINEIKVGDTGVLGSVRMYSSDSNGTLQWGTTNGSERGLIVGQFRLTGGRCDLDPLSSKAEIRVAGVDTTLNFYNKDRAMFLMSVSPSACSLGSVKSANICASLTTLGGDLRLNTAGLISSNFLTTDSNKTIIDSGTSFLGLSAISYNTSSNAYYQSINYIQPKLDIINSDMLYLASITGNFATSSLIYSASANAYAHSISYTNDVSANLVQYINAGSVSMASVAAASANAYNQAINYIQPQIDAQQITISELVALTGASGPTPSLSGYTLLTTTASTTGILQNEIDGINENISYLASITGGFLTIADDLAQDAAMSGSLISLTYDASANAYTQAISYTNTVSADLVSFINNTYLLPTQIITNNLVLNDTNWSIYHNARITSSVTPVIISTNTGIPDGFETEIIQNGVNTITISAGSMPNLIAFGLTTTNGDGAIVSLRVMNGGTVKAYTDGNLA